MLFQRISILGVGLLDGPIGLAARSAISVCQVAGYGQSTSHAEKGVGDRRDRPSGRLFGPGVQGGDLVIRCTPVGIFSSLISQIAGELSTNCPAAQPQIRRHPKIPAQLQNMRLGEFTLEAKNGRPKLRFPGTRPRSLALIPRSTLSALSTSAASAWSPADPPSVQCRLFHASLSYPAFDKTCGCLPLPSGC